MSDKVLFVINGLGTGGSERSLAEMLPYFVQADICPVIVCLHRRSEGVETEVLQQGFRVYFLSGRILLSQIQEVRRIIHDEKPNLVHTAIFESNLVGRFAAIGSSVPVTSSLVNMPYDQSRHQDPKINRFKLKLVRFLDGWTARHLTVHLHAVSQAVKNAAVVSLAVRPEHVTVIHRGRNAQRLGVRSEERYRQIRVDLGILQDEIVLINVGRHEFQKGQEYLLQALPKILSVYPHLVLLIAGRAGNQTVELKMLTEQLRISEHVRFLGHRTDIPNLLTVADLFVFPSLYEGLPGALIEAMALGLPIVASDIEPVREVVEPDRNAILVQPASIDCLARATIKLLNDKRQCEQFSKRSRQIFEEKFTIAKSAQGMVDLYRRMIESEN